MKFNIHTQIAEIVWLILRRKNKMKNRYENPTLNLIEIDINDIITASPPDEGIGDNDSSNDGEWD